jgi:hypothetical protein
MSLGHRDDGGGKALAKLGSCSHFSLYSDLNLSMEQGYLLIKGLGCNDPGLKSLEVEESPQGK